MSSRIAALLLDLQVDFLNDAEGKMPVDRDSALRVLAAANDFLAGRALAGRWQGAGRALVGRW